MRSLPIVMLVLAAACRSGGGVPAASPSVSYEAHMAEVEKLEADATRHDEAAEVARQRGATYECATAPESEQSTSGGERFNGTRICDDVAQSDRRRHEDEAGKLRKQAERHRGMARSLLDAERAACAGYGVERLRDTPIGRARSAARIDEVDGGVRVTLAGGPGLALDEVRRELACHRARAALYDDGGYMAHDPALVPATRIAVDAAPGGGIIVTIRGDGAAAGLVRARAAALSDRP